MLIEEVTLAVCWECEGRRDAACGDFSSMLFEAGEGNLEVGEELLCDLPALG